MGALSHLSAAARAAVEQTRSGAGAEGELPSNPLDLVRAAAVLAGCPDNDYDLGRSAQIGDPGDCYAAIWGRVLDLEGVVSTGDTDLEAAYGLLVAIDNQRDDTDPGQ